MPKGEPLAARTWDTLRLFFYVEAFLAAGGLGLALIPFAAVWLIGAAVSHNASYLAGIGWYAVIATSILVFRWARDRREGEGASAHSEARKFIGVASSIALPGVMYLCARSTSLGVFGEATQASAPATLPPWLLAYGEMHLDVVTLGLYSTVLPDSFTVASISLLSRLSFFFTRLLYTVGVVILVGQMVLHRHRDASGALSGLRVSAGQLAEFTAVALAYNLLVVGSTAAVSIIPGPYTVFLAVAVPVTITVGILAVLTPRARGAARLTLSMNNLRLIGLALLDFHNRHRRLPPRVSSAADGSPLLSWRVHLLPALGHEALFARFRLDEPWDSAHNIRLLPEMPDVFHGPGSPRDGKTAYLAAVVPGNTSGWVHAGPPTGAPLVVEVDAEHASPWTKPVDWEVSPDDPGRGLSRRGGRTLALASSGEVRLIQPGKEGEELSGLTHGR